MKKLLILPFLYCLLLSTPAVAQLDKIELFSDASGTSCDLYDQSAGLRSVYVFLTGPVPSSAVRFKAPRPDCWVGATFVGDVTSFTTIGSSQIDMSVGFGACLTPPIRVDQINFFSAGTANACCQINAVAPELPRFPLEYLTCDFGEVLIPPDGRKVTINPNDSCHCNQPLAIEATTWGRVKSLYR
jgi:hypothetical protein